MLWCNVVLTVFAIFVAEIDAASAFPDLPMENGLAIIPSKRVLRGYGTEVDVINVEKTKEERTKNSAISKMLDKLVYKGLEKTNQSPTYLFTAAHLGEVGVKLDENNPAFIRWLRYVH
ncbi:RxLR effector protein, partial [Phytophthora megakarya]